METTTVFKTSKSRELFDDSGIKLNEPTKNTNGTDTEDKLATDPDSEESFWADYIDDLPN